ncbi:protein DEEPER ROOTING 1-like [Bidens hawaiensis]|uniref:protein DEEPER ROOTING 1-like n=1 Tax=Bidens hawaiensis TaxID=980011 RepID=UPI004049B9A0
MNDETKATRNLIVVAQDHELIFIFTFDDKTDHIAAAAAASSKEEFSDWPQSLLSIGTFGLSTLRSSSDPEESHPQTPTPEQVQQELISYLDTDEEEEEEEESDTVFENRQVHLPRSMSSKGKDISVDHKNRRVIRKKSLTFLLKKIFTSRNRLNHVLRDPLPDPTFDKSRMEKILRAILNKKMHPQTCTAKTLPNKYLVTKDISMGEDDDDDNEGSTWVKTDSEYIVLEI